MGLTSLYDFYGSWRLYICRSLFGHSTIFVASLVFIKSTTCFVIRKNFGWYWAVSRIALWQSSIGLKVYMIFAVICMSLRGVWHLCNLSWVYALFYNREDIVYLYSTLWRRARLWLEVFASTVVDSYHGYHICPHTLFLRDAVALLWDSYTFV